MTRILVAYVTTLVVFLGMDFVWLTQMTPRLYQPAIGPLMAAKPNLGAAVLFYALYIVGVVVFAVLPALERKTWFRAAGLAALFGFLAYGTYDLTNLATLRGFTVQLTVADMAWGAVVSAVAASVGYAAASRVRSRPS
jgi:uncharacterized membrane protein